MRRTCSRIHTSADGSIIKEKDFLVVMDAGCEKKTVRDFLRFSKKTKLPIKYVFLSHFHWDHVDNLPVFRKHFRDIIVIGSSLNPKVKNGIDRKKEFILGKTRYVVIPTPGHSEKKDDVCVYMPKEKVLFSGDLVQPQGFSYEQCNFATPVPYFEFGDDYISSLRKILKLDIKYVITGHGLIRYKNSIRVTLDTVLRIRDLAKKITKNNKNLPKNKICEMIFRVISEERNFNNVEKKLKDIYYHELDRKGLLYFVRKYR